MKFPAFIDKNLLNPRQRMLLTMLISVFIGLLGSALIAGVAYRLRSLNRSGAYAAIAVGTILYACGSLAWYGALLVFFISSSMLSKWKKRRKQFTETGYEKGARRDAGQVLANGGLASLLCLLWQLWPSDLWWYAFIGVMASVNADTWATEIGGLSRRDPVSIVSFRRVPRGTSGGISLLGSSAAASGAITIGLAVWVLVGLESAPQVKSGPLLLAVTLVGGLFGAFADSLLGATVQRMNQCMICGQEIENSMHCGQKARQRRGLSWMNNDAVNAISSAAGGLAALILGLIIF